MAEAGGHLIDNLVRFGTLLRGLGLPVAAAQEAELARALGLIGVAGREDVRAAAAALLVHRRADLVLFELAFDQFFRDPATRFKGERPGQRFRAPPRAGEGTGATPEARDAAREDEASRGERGAARPAEAPGIAETGRGEAGADAEEATLAGYSPHAALARKDFAAMSEAELDAVRRFLRHYRLTFAGRLTRRLERASRGARLDLRRMLKREVGTLGAPPRLCHRAQKRKPRPIIVLCDVSGSMAPYARVLLAFLYTLTHEARRVEAFGFSTALSRITRALKERAIDAALGQAAGAIRDYGGGTRIGAALKAFNFEWGRRVLGQGPIVLIISDGWDRGDTALLAREMERLSLSCHALIWLNPLAAMPGFEPLQKGLLAALPFVDHFLPIHNLDSLDKLARLITVLDTPLPTRHGGARQRAAAA
jgi:uncharacterized protein with von Willebrand factor type A (vWA) domain